MKRGTMILRIVCAFFATGTCSKPKKNVKVTGGGSLPGAEALPEALQAELQAVIRRKGADYKPRTRHLRSDRTALYTNRLAKERSPYLQQHAHNPVNWYPWGEEAFAAAKRLRRPVLLSIGYSTCHWCHVMEEESFEDEETARYLNENYIAIKVDREERPDVDSIYMSAVHAMGLRGGWPLNVWLTPERLPFYGGTYFPPDKRQGRPAFVTILTKLRTAFDTDHDELLQVAQNLTAYIEKMSKPPVGIEAVPGPEVLRAAAHQLLTDYDPVYGGRKGGGTKFPSSMPVRFLLRYYRRSGDEKYRDMATHTLDKMASGGMYDHAGGGFHRYSTDPQWLVPHFEKMLYDNALLVPAYIEAFQLTGDVRHSEVARHVLAYVARDLRAPEGGFYSATDADSTGPSGEREEGYYFSWTPAEIREVLGAHRAELVNGYWGVSEPGNFEGRSLLHVAQPLDSLAKTLKWDRHDAKLAIEQARESLYQKRKSRPAPAIDNKILVAWNGLMVSAYAQAARVLGPDNRRKVDYLTIASSAADFILRDMRKEGRLLRSYQGGTAHLKAYLDDYAFFIAGLLDLFMASAEIRWLDSALELQAQLDAHYSAPSGGYYRTADDHEKLLAREVPTRDGAIPSGNSYAIQNLQRLYQLTGRESFRVQADAGLRALGAVLRRSPTSLSDLLAAIDFGTDAVKQIVVVAPRDADATVFREVISAKFLPNTVYVETNEGESLTALSTRVPLVAEKFAIDGKTTVYVCEDTQCELPTNDPNVLKAQLAKTRPL